MNLTDCNDELKLSNIEMVDVNLLDASKAAAATDVERLQIEILRKGV